MKISSLVVLLGCVCCVAASGTSFTLKSDTPLNVQQQAVEDLIRRLVGDVEAANFEVEVTGPASSEQDTFTLSSVTHGTTNKIHISANSGVAAASGFHWYLKYLCNASISWSGDQLYSFVGRPLPAIPTPLTIRAAVPVSYYQNVCTVSYSMAWWDWARWEREIDWMAMAGINLPLAFTGQEYVWQRVFAQFNLSEADLAGFFAGPGFYAWQRMGNIRGWAGPTATSKAISDDFLYAQFLLQKKILARMTSLGMTPVLPAFAGHVPQALQSHYPKADISRSPNWGNFPDQYCCDYLLEAHDPLFVQIGAAFVKAQMELYGNVTHVYNTDTFNEMRPKSSDPTYLRTSAAAVYDSLATADPKAVWLMQGWLFQDSGFWGNTEMEALLSGVPDDGMLILDLFSDVSPVFPRCKSYFGKPFVWCTLNSFGGNNNLYGRLPLEASAPVTALHTPNVSMVGVGLTMEGINQNWPVYDLMTEMRWHESAVDTVQWISQYHTRRYGGFSAHADVAWQTLLTSVYNNTKDDWGGTKSMIVLRPSLSLARDGFMPTNLFYDPNLVVSALANLKVAAKELATPSSLLAYDLVDVARQVLSNVFYQQHATLVNATKTGTLQDVGVVTAAMTQTIRDMDRLLATNTQFTLAPWITSARAWGHDDTSKDYFEWNARNQITLWGPDGEISDYASKQWSGLVSSYYLPRWEKFFERVVEAKTKGVQVDEAAFVKEIMVFEQSWQHMHLDSDAIPTPTEDTLHVVTDLLASYFPDMTL